VPGDAIVYINSPALFIELPPVLTLGQGLPKGQREGQREQPASLECGHDTRDTQKSKAQSVTARQTHKGHNSLRYEDKGRRAWAGWGGGPGVLEEVPTALGGKEWGMGGLEHKGKGNDCLFLDLLGR
jgi:hypothetical protein